MAYSSITKPSDYFNTKLYTGNGTTDHAITGVGFQPDLNWIKERSNADNHIIHQVGFNAGDYLVTNSTQELSNSGEMTKSLDSDGFTVGTRGEVNTDSSNYVSWNWLAGGTPSSNTDGSITSTVSANTTSGFSIVSYTGNATSGATVGHGLGSTPKMIIARKRNGTENWLIYNEAIGNSNIILLNTGAASTADNIWTSSPTSSVFSIHSVDGINGSGNTYIAYCFAEKKGYSKFGSYTGNGDADGPFIYTGFKPAWTIIKRSNNSGSWYIHDSTRKPFNENDAALVANSTNSESGEKIDYVSNGFKHRIGANGNFNGSGDTYIYMAFAENPLVVNVNGGLPATAR